MDMCVCGHTYGEGGEEERRRRRGEGEEEREQETFSVVLKVMTETPNKDLGPRAEC